MAKSDALPGSLDLPVLKVLSRRMRLHGYAIMSAIEVISGEVLRVEEGSLCSGPFAPRSLPASPLLWAGPTPDRGPPCGYLFPQDVGPPIAPGHHPVGSPRFLG
jgi:hypothetical protein